MKKLILLSCVLGGSFVNAGVEETVALKDVPESIMQKLEKQYPQFNFVSANTETESDGLMVYEIQGHDTQGRQIEVDIMPTGQVDEVEIVFALEDVPAIVLKAIDRKYKGFKPTLIEATHSASLKVIGYEVEGVFEGSPIDLEVSADGRYIVKGVVE